MDRQFFEGTKATVLVVLQNAYTKGELKNGYHYRRWFNEFVTSRSGYRLSVMFGRYELKHLRYTNVCPRMGNHVDHCGEPDIPHIRRTLKRVEPDYVVACGDVARKVLRREWDGHLICIPHPTFRCLTDHLLQAAGGSLRWHIVSRLLRVQPPDLFRSWFIPRTLRLEFVQHRESFAVFEMGGTSQYKRELTTVKRSKR